MFLPNHSDLVDERLKARVFNEKVRIKTAAQFLHFHGEVTA